MQEKVSFLGAASSQVDISLPFGHSRPLCSPFSMSKNPTGCVTAVTQQPASAQQVEKIAAAMTTTMTTDGDEWWWCAWWPVVVATTGRRMRLLYLEKWPYEFFSRFHWTVCALKKGSSLVERLEGSFSLALLACIGTGFTRFHS